MKMEIFIEEDTRNIVQRTMTPQPIQSRHLGTSHSSPNHDQLPCPIFLILRNGLKFLPFQRWFWFWEKPEVAGCQIWAVEGLSHLGNLIFHQNTLHKMWCMKGVLSWWSCQSPIAHSCGLLNHPNSFCGGMFKLNAKFEADLLLSLHSHFKCESHTVHMLIQRHLRPLLISTAK